jgi:tetratricopeptide (TPR) repeat protein
MSTTVDRPLDQADPISGDDFARLLALLRLATGGTFAFALYNSVPVRERVVQALRAQLAPLPVFEWTYSPLDPYPVDYLLRLTEEQRAGRAIVFLYDVERGGADAWRSMDYARERFSARPHAQVFWITSKAHGEAIRNAPHFWSQRSSVFDFRIALPDAWQQSRELAWQAERKRGVSIESLDEIARQLRLYEGLLEEYEQSPHTTKRTLYDLHQRLANLLYYTDRYGESKQHALAAFKLAHQLDDRLGEANTQKTLGDLALIEDHLSEARAAYAAALAVYRALGYRLDEANTQKALGDLALREDDLSGARAAYEAALAVYRSIGHRLGEANIQKALGNLALRDDDLIRARAAYRAALPVYRAIGDRLGEANTQQALGDLALREDDLSGARAAYEAALPVYRAIGARLGEANTYRSLGRLTGDTVWFQRAVDLHTQIHDSYSVALDNLYWGRRCLSNGESKRGVELLSAAQAIFNRIGLPQYAKIVRDAMARAEQTGP